MPEDKAKPKPDATPVSTTSRKYNICYTVKIPTGLLQQKSDFMYSAEEEKHLEDALEYASKSIPAGTVEVRVWLDGV